MASIRHASCSGVSPFPSPTATGSGVTIEEAVGLGANVAVGDGVAFDSPPHATEITSNRAAIVTINRDHCMTDTGTSLFICVTVANRLNHNRLLLVVVHTVSA